MELYFHCILYVALMFGYGGAANAEKNDDCESAPGQVTDLKVSPLPSREISTQLQLEVSWEPPDNNCHARSFTFEVHYSAVPEQDQCTDGVSVTNQEETTKSELTIYIEKLHPYTYYNVSVALQVFATNTESTIQKLLSYWKHSNSLILQTNEDLPSSAPANVINTESTDNSLSFSWSEIPCLFRNGGIIKYMYKYKLSEENTAEGPIIAQKSITILVGLLCGRDYVFKVAGWTSIGIGKYSEWVHGSTSTIAPSKVANLNVTAPESPSELVVSWKKPSQRGCPKTGGFVYTAHYSVVPYDQCGQGHNVSNGSITWIERKRFTIPNLHPFTTYNVQVKVQAGRNNDGIIHLRSEWIENSFERTTRTKIPSKGPEHITLNNTELQSLTFSWQKIPCRIANGIITNYVFEMFKGDTDITGKVTFDIISEEKVMISRLACGQEYRFQIAGENSAGTGTFSNSTGVTLSQEPEYIGNIQKSLKTAHSIMVSWAVGPACPPPIYQVIHRLLKDQCGTSGLTQSSSKLESSITSYSITSLHPKSLYEVFVTAANIAGVKSSIRDSFTTRESAPSKGPEHITLNNTELQSLTFSWQKIPCRFANGIITRYVFEMFKGDTNITGEVTFDIISEEKVMISRLACGQEYRFQIAGENSAGTGPFSNSTGVTLSQEPEYIGHIQKSMKTSHSIMVSWVGSACPPPVYIVSYKLLKDQCGESGPTQSSSELESEITSYTITLLHPNSLYEVYVTAENIAGVKKSTRGNFTTKESVPDEPPGNVRFEPAGPTFLEVSWNEIPCNSRNGEIISYEYRYGLDERNLKKSKTNDSRVRLDDLQCKEEYIFSVAGVTRRGVGMASGYNTWITKYRKPGPVQELRVNASSSRSLYVTWDQPDDIGCPEPIYKIWYRISYALVRRGSCGTRIIGDPDYSELEPTTYNTDYTIRNLHPRSIYSVTVMVLNSQAGNSRIKQKQGKTDPAGPYNVNNLSAQPLSSRSLSVAWQPADDPFCDQDLREYEVRYQLTNRGQCGPVTDEIHTYLNTTETSVTLSNLEPYSTYRVFIVARNSRGSENTNQVLPLGTTLQDRPNGTAIAIAVQNKERNSIEFTWTKPLCLSRRGVIVGYVGNLTNTRTRQSRLYDIRTDRNQPTFNFVDLTPFVKYTLRIAAKTAVGRGPFSVEVTGKTLEATPPAPSSSKILTASATSITLVWSAPDPPYGIIEHYYIRHWKTIENMTRNTRYTVEVDDKTNQYTLVGLDSSVSYSVRIRAETGAGKGSWSEIMTKITKDGIPSNPVNVSCSSKERSLNLTWKLPVITNGEIVAYEVWYRPVAKPYDTSFNPNLSNNIFVSRQTDGNIHHITLTEDVVPSTKYEIILAANTSAGRGNSTEIEVFTLPATDIEPPKQPEMMSSTLTSLKIRIPTVESHFVVSYQLGVQRDRDEVVVKRYSVDPSTYEDDPYNYIAAEIPKSEAGVPFVVGDNKTHDIYYNAPLREGVTYDIRVRAVSRANESFYTPWGEPLVFTSVRAQKAEDQSTGAATGVSVVIVLLIVLCVFLVVVIVYKRRRAILKQTDDQNGVEAMEMDQKRHKGEDGKESTKRVKVLPSASELNAKKKPATAPKQDKVKVAAVKPRPQEEDDYKPVPVDHLSKYIQTHRAGYRYGDDDEDDDEVDASGFTKEFNSIPFGQTHPCNISKNPDNVKKNRYLDIAAYDHSRVKLQLLDEKPHSDYINASFVKGYKTKVYIACQGPNSLTLNDMWRMIWEQKSAKVIMLTNLREKGKIKCERYWPVEVNTDQLYGTTSVKMTSEECFANYTIRTFEIKKTDADLPACEFKQFHYTSWPDMGVPQSATPLLNFMEVAGAYTFEGAGPDIVHCSAGVGRTGTYIVIEAMLAMAADERQIDVHASVSQIREDRIKMVQTEVQYEFIFDAVLQSVFCGDTSIMVTDLRTEYTALLAKDRTTGRSKLEEQFKTLEFLTEVPPPNAYKGGKLEENTDKNRFPEKIPPDRVRPYLMTAGIEGSTNYINAAYLDGYRGKAMYLATQMPLPNTVNDIWRMVYDYKSTTIVMLNDMDKDDATIGQYWPESGNQCYGKIDVSLESLNQNENEIVTRTFTVTLGGSSDSVTVQQFQYTGWPAGSDVPNNVTSYLSLANLVTQHHKCGPITVHCMDGVGRSGTFCALLSELDRMQKDKVVDVFQTVRTLRKGRPGVVETVRQYKLLFESAQANLEEYSIYENFNA